MTDHDENPYESPQAGEPPINRIGLVGRFLAIAAVIAGTVVSFAVCFFSVCYSGFVVGESGPFGPLSAGGVWLIMGLSGLAGVAAAVLVARLLGRLLLRRKDQE